MSRTDHPLKHPTVNDLEAALVEPLRELLRVAKATAEAERVELWAVGGAVRDLAVGIGVRDLDLAVAGDAGGLATAVAERTGGAATVEARFGTASVEAGGCRIDLAALRTERYARPGALPTVRLGASIEEDLARRDFSVNAVALGLAGARAGEVIDPFGGSATSPRGGSECCMSDRSSTTRRGCGAGCATRRALPCGRQRRRRG